MELVHLFVRVTIEPDTKEWLEKSAEAERRSMANYVSMLIEQRKRQAEEKINEQVA